MKYALFLALLLSLASPALAETTLLASSRTHKVVAYANQALVTRSLILKDLKARLKELAEQRADGNQQLQPEASENQPLRCGPRFTG